MIGVPRDKQKMTLYLKFSYSIMDDIPCSLCVGLRDNVNNNNNDVIELPG